MSRRLRAFALLFLAARVAAAAPGDDDRKAEAQAHFQRGLELSAEEAWDAAFAEYAASRALYATKAATKNAALCLRQLHRFDEALDLLESLGRDFSALSEQDRAFAEKEAAQVRPFVATLQVREAEPGAAVVVDGRARGVAPLAAPLRVSAGSHTVRVFKSGYAPFETRVEVAGGQRAVIDARLAALARSGRLRVTEETGAAASVVVDNVAVGEAPWEGVLAPGDHTVVLRGAGTLGTQPASAPVRVDQLTPLTLRLEPLEAHLRVEATPSGALVAVDGTNVGRGVWDGRLREGVHQLEIAAEGFLATRRRVEVGPGKPDVVRVQLERDLDSSMWRQSPSRVFVDLRAAGALGPALGGELDDACTGTCERGLTTGFLGKIQVGYELSSGLGFGVDVGYARLKRRLTARPDSLALQPAGSLAPNLGVSDDALTMKGVLVGASASLHRGAPLSWMARVGAGAWLATVDDTRSGTFTTVASYHPDPAVPAGPPASYLVGPVAETSDARFAYLAPEVRLGWRFGEHFELAASAELWLLLAITQPRWDPGGQVVATGNCAATNPDPKCVRDGFAVFSPLSLSGRVFAVASLGLAARYAF